MCDASVGDQLPSLLTHVADPVGFQSQPLSDTSLQAHRLRPPLVGFEHPRRIAGTPVRFLREHMRVRRILVVYKKSAYHLYSRVRRDREFLRLLREDHLVTKRFVKSHEELGRALGLVREILRKRKIAARFVYRAYAFSERDYDLVLSVGGDGTFLEASHCIRSRPILGLNSNTLESVGSFCGTTVHTLNHTLDDIEHNRCSRTRMLRLRVRIARKIIPIPVLNDVLITHLNPAATCRYIVKYRNREEEHKSSGIWVATAAGSTGALSGAGGAFMPITSRDFQFRIRELYPEPHRKNRITGGIVRANEKLVVYSKIRAGRIFVDGPHVAYCFPIGARVEISATAPPLIVYGFNEGRRRKLWGREVIENGSRQLT